MRARFAAMVVALCAAVTVGAAGVRPAAIDRPDLETLLDRAAWYLDFFIDQFENVVAEEVYVQDASTPQIGRAHV